MAERESETEAMRKSVKAAVGAGILAGLGYAAWRTYRARVPTAPPGSIEWETAPFPFPPAPRPTSTPAPRPQPVAQPKAEPAPAPTPKPKPIKAAKKKTIEAWVEPNGSGACPKSHPVKAKMSSGIFHVPGGQNYDRTNPDRCYVDADAAQADGLRQSKR